MLCNSIFEPRRPRLCLYTDLWSVCPGYILWTCNGWLVSYGTAAEEAQAIWSCIQLNGKVNRRHLLSLRYGRPRSPLPIFEFPINSDGLTHRHPQCHQAVVVQYPYHAFLARRILCRPFGIGSTSHAELAESASVIPYALLSLSSTLPSIQAVTIDGGRVSEEGLTRRWSRLRICRPDFRDFLGMAVTVIRGCSEPSRDDPWSY